VQRTVAGGVRPFSAQPESVHRLPGGGELLRGGARLTVESTTPTSSVHRLVSRASMPISQVVVERGYAEVGKLTEQQLDEALDVLSMTHPASDRGPARPARSGAEQ
jgi:hypothetical protein